MKPFPCENCLVQVVCKNPCPDIFLYQLQLDHQLFKLSKFIYSTGGKKRKHIKRQQLKHYNSYARKSIQFHKQRAGIWGRIMQDL